MLFVHALQRPGVRRGKDEAEKGFVRELEIPFHPVPAFFGRPPGSGEGKGAVGGGDGAAMRAGEKGERVVVAAAEFRGHVDVNGWAKPFEGERGGGGRQCGRGGSGGLLRGVARERRVEAEGVRFVGGDRFGTPQTFRTEEGFDASEGVGKFVGIAKRVLEEMMLSFFRKSGSQFESPGHHRGGGADGIEVGVEEAEKSRRGARRFGKAQGALVEVAIVKGERELHADGCSLARGETGTKGVEAPPEKKEKRFQSLEGILEFLGELVVLGRAMESEEAVVFAVEDVVKASDGRTEAFGQSLAWELGEIAEGLEPPERKEFGVEWLI